MANLIGLINKAYLFLNNSPKWQQLFELTLKEYLPENSHSKLPGLCKKCWVERHMCLNVFLKMYELLVTFLDAVVSPHKYSKFEIVYWKLELGQRYHHKSPGTENLFVVTPDCSGFSLQPRIFLMKFKALCIKAAETGSRYFWSLHDHQVC